jgi:methyl-accepting chemotaxis protein
VKHPGVPARTGQTAPEMPAPRIGRHDLLPWEVEQRLAALAGVEPAPRRLADDLEQVPALDVPVDRSVVSEPDIARRVLRVAEFVTVGAFVLLIVAAMLAARFGDSSLRVHELPFAAWGLGATAAAVTLAAMAGQGYSDDLRSRRRRVLGPLLMVALLVAMSGVVANAGGVAGPAWVLFLPVVLVAGAVTGPTFGLLVGAGAAAGVYAAAGLSDTLTVAGVGRLVVLLPAFPAVGWSAGALAGLARAAAREAHVRRQALIQDVKNLSAVLDRVAAGDLSEVPAPGRDADAVTTALAVVFADTLLALRRLVRQLDSVAGTLATRSVELAGAAEQEATAIGAQVAAVAETTTTIEQLAATAGTIAETAVRVAQFAGSTRQDVDTGAATVGAANEAMQRIDDRVAELAARAELLTERITAVAQTTHVIDELARRTSILAVNASIEAARAGDHGRGFANVAHEVGVLADRARTATARIGEIVGELRTEAVATAEASREGHSAVAEGVALQAEVVDALARIAGMVDRTTTAAREITEATRQQRFASEAVVSAMMEVTTAGTRYRAGGTRHAEAAGRMRDLAADLRIALGRFRLTRAESEAR